MINLFLSVYNKIKDTIRVKQDPVAYARSIGVQIGERVKLISIKPGYATFGSEPFLIRIGDEVTIAGGVQFITHDGGVWVFNSKVNEATDPDNIDVCGPISIGNNVFVGYGVILMPNTRIGDNVVIGAGSVVTGNIPDDSVAVGVPAKVIMSIEGYRKKVSANAVRIRHLDPQERKQMLLRRLAWDTAAQSRQDAG